MAERVGFEPTVSVNPQRFSRPSQSTTLAPLREVVRASGGAIEGAPLVRLSRPRKPPIAPTARRTRLSPMTIPAAQRLSPNAVDAPPVSHARFAIGEVVRHRMFDFRGVIFDVDPVFNNSDE